MKIDISFAETMKKEPEISKLIDVTVKKTLQTEKRNDNYEISVYIVDDEMMRGLNSRFRGIEQPTDVLSFPMISYDMSQDGNPTPIVEGQAINPQSGDVLLGDIVISLPRATQQAMEYGHSRDREICFLTVHGMLHLLGYNHESEKEGNLMRAKEKDILLALDQRR